MATTDTPLGWPPPEWGAPLEEPPALPFAQDAVPAPGPIEWPPPDWTAQHAPEAAGGLPPEPLEPEELPPMPFEATQPEPQPPQGSDLAADMEAERAAELGIDAVSGGALPPPVTEEAPQQEVSPLGREVQRLESLSPEDLAAEHALRESTRAQLAAEQELEALRVNREKAEANERLVVEARDRAVKEYESIKADAEALAKQKVDPDRWWSSRSTGQQIAGFIGAAIGGFVNPGGENQTIALAMRAIDRDIDAQKTDIENGFRALDRRQGLVDEIYQKTGDVYRAAETARLAALQSLEGELAAKAAMFDPAGTTAMRIAKDRQQVRAAIAEAQAKAVEATFKRSLDLAKFNEEQRHRKVQESQGWAAHNVAKQRLELDKGKQAHEERMDLAKLDEARQKHAKETELANAQGQLINPWTGKVIGVSRFGQHKFEETRKDQDAINDHATYRARVGEYQRKLKQVGATYGGPGASWSVLQDQDKAELRAMHEALVADYVRIKSGAAATDAERDAAKTVIPGPETYFQRSDPAEVVDIIKTEGDRALGARLRGVGLSNEQVDGYLRDVAAMDDVDIGGAESAIDRDTKSALTPIQQRTLWVREAAKDAPRNEKYAAVTRIKLAAIDGDAEARAALAEIERQGDKTAQAFAGPALKELRKIDEVRSRWPDATGFHEDGSLRERSERFERTGQLKKRIEYDKQGRVTAVTHYDEFSQYPVTRHLIDPKLNIDREVIHYGDRGQVLRREKR